MKQYINIYIFLKYIMIDENEDDITERFSELNLGN